MDPIRNVNPDYNHMSKPIDNSSDFTMSETDFPAKPSLSTKKDSRLIPHLVGDDPYLNFKALTIVISKP